MKIAKTEWNPDKKLISTHISGDVDKTDIEKWEASLYTALSQIKENETFKIFVNLYGFKAVDLEAHKRFRNIIPLTLAAYGWKVGYIDLFEEEAKSITYANTRGIHCAGAAHVHQDETKIALYQSRYSSKNEQYFNDPRQAAAWLESLE